MNSTHTARDNTPHAIGSGASRDYERIEAAIRYLHEHRKGQPELDAVAAAVGLSPHYFQRMFRRWCGVSPKQLLGYLTVQDAKKLLEARWSVLDTSDEVGLSGPARLHDAFVSFEAMTPGEYKAGGAGLEIRYAHHDSPFGRLRVAVTDRGVCGLDFVDDEYADEACRARWPNATWTPDPGAGAELAADLARGSLAGDVRVHLTGTNFQVKVWRALLNLPAGRVTGYGALAEAIGHPRAHRAVGSALARNPVMWLIPCHRVIRSVADLGVYRGGEQRKRAMIAWECLRSDADATQSAVA